MEISPWTFLFVLLLISYLVIRGLINRVKFGKKISKKDRVTDNQLKVIKRAIEEASDPGWEERPGMFSRVDRDSEFIKLCKKVEKSQDRYTKDQASTMISYIIGRETVDKDTFIKIDVSMPYSEFLNSK